MTAPAWLTSLPRPSLMAVGDSLLNGMRSYTINDALAAGSIPSLVGGALRAHPDFAPFRRADYPQPILIDAERELGASASSTVSVVALAEVLGRLGRIKAAIAGNARAWIDRFQAPPAPAGTPEAFDNLAVGGARIEDAFSITYGQIQARLDAMAPVIRAVDDPLDWSGDWPAGDPYAAPGARWGLGDVHIALNARHLRNPANRPGLDGMTVVDMVAARRPRVLLVCLGANHGIVDVVMRNAGDDGMEGLRRFAAAWPACARELAGLPGVEAVVVLLMPRPSQVPCLMPPRRGGGATVEEAPTGPGGYFDHYVSALQPISTGEGYTAQEMIRLDEEMDRINGEVRAASEEALAGSGKALVCASLADLLARHDHKHRRGPPLPGAAGSGRAYSNYTLGQIPVLFGPDRLRGGLCGYDHIHPTAIGYRYIAEEIRMALPADIESRPIAVTDEGDDFLLAPHWPSIAALDALYPQPGRAAVAAAATAEAAGADRLLFRPGWLR